MHKTPVWPPEIRTSAHLCYAAPFDRAALRRGNFRYACNLLNMYIYMYPMLCSGNCVSLLRIASIAYRSGSGVFVHMLLFMLLCVSIHPASRSCPPKYACTALRALLYACTWSVAARVHLLPIIRKRNKHQSRPHTSHTPHAARPFLTGPGIWSDENLEKDNNLNRFIFNIKVDLFQSFVLIRWSTLICPSVWLFCNLKINVD